MGLAQRAAARGRSVIRSPLTWGLCAHAVSRWVVYREGIRFDATPLPWFWQFVDPDLLRHDYLRSIFYLHAQPPLFNAFLGAVLKLAPEHTDDAFWACFLALGVLLHVSLFALLRRLGVGPLAAAVAALVFTVSPPAICYESWLFYTYPLTACLAAAAVMAHRYVARRRILDGLIFFSLIALAALTRSLFHLVFCVAVLLLILRAVPRRDRWRTLGVAAVPLLLVFGLYAKNALLFHQFTSSTWVGMNLARMSLFHVPAADRTRMIREHRLSPIAGIPPFSPLERYPRDLVVEPGRPIPILANRVKPGNVPNFNHYAYTDISRLYLRDSLVMIRERPDLYAHNVGVALGIYALPSTEYWFLDQNRRLIRHWDRVWRVVPSGSAGRPDSALRPSFRYEWWWLKENAAWGWMALLLIALALSLRHGLRSLRGAGPRPRAAMLLFVAFCIAYVTVFGNLFEVGENNRFRFMIDPLIFVVAWAGAAALLRRVLARVGARA